MKKGIIVALLLALCASAASAQPATKGESSSSIREIQGVAQNFWLALNLGDMEQVQSLVRTSDNASVPLPQGEGAEVMKMKDLPQLRPLREELKRAAGSAFVLAPAKIAADNKTAAVKVTANKKNVKKYFELRTAHDTYMSQAYAAKKEGRKEPAVAEVRKSVLDKNSHYQKAIEGKVKLLLEEKLPDLVLEKTDLGWRINLQKVFEQQPQT